MTTRYDELKTTLRARPRSWLVTGVAGFIGSGLLEALLKLGQSVVGLDNFSTGYRRNLDDVLGSAAEPERFRFMEGDIRELATCREACADVDIVLHQAALGSVPRSIHDPIGANESNVDGFLNMLVAARDAGVGRFVYAASSATYGDHPGLPKLEDQIGRPLSPYAVTKLVNELYAGAVQRADGLECVGLRYFNVFGRRQDPNGAYAAVIPRWTARLLSGEPCEIYGDGETSRDFCYLDNAVQANLLAATAEDPAATDQVYNVACGERTTLNDLFAAMRERLAPYAPDVADAEPVHLDFRPGDVRHSQADISKITRLLGYQPTHLLRQGLDEALEWYVRDARSSHGAAA